MPRGARLDAPGTLHHVMIRGIEKRSIVDDDNDRINFVTRMGDTAIKTKTGIYAWALMNNHVHILLRSGESGLSTFMRQLLTGYATSYNRRHQRHGHLFQNRYKSIVVQEDLYFIELVRYIHLNPLRAKAVESLARLDRYAWCGHSVIMNRRTNEWQNRESVLNRFGKNDKDAQKQYRWFLEEGLDQGRRPELTGGGLIRSKGGWSAVKTLRKSGKKEKSDERILGNGKFVAKIIDQADEKVKHQFAFAQKPQNDISQALLSVCQKHNVDLSLLQSGTRRQPLPKIRKIMAVKFVTEWGISLAETARQLGITTSAVSQILRRHHP